MKKALLAYGMLFLSQLVFSDPKIQGIDSYKGTYGDSYRQLIILPATESRVLLYIDVHNGPPNYSGGSFFGYADLKNEKLFHSSNWRDARGRRCEFYISRLKGEKTNMVALDFTESKEKGRFDNSDCGLLGDSYEGQYRFKSSSTPKYVQNKFTVHRCDLDELKAILANNVIFKIDSTFDCE